MRKTLKTIRKERNKAKENKIKKYQKKIEHYHNIQKDSMNETTLYPGTSSHVPNRLHKYKDLSVFKTAEHLPKKQAPLGPFICDTSIKLDSDEISLLSKQPKFSLMGEITEVDMLFETEKMTCKHRYGQQTFNKANGRNLEPDSVENKTIETKIREMWSEIRKDIIYDPC